MAEWDDDVMDWFSQPAPMKKLPSKVTKPAAATASPVITTTTRVADDSRRLAEKLRRRRRVHGPRKFAVPAHLRQSTVCGEDAYCSFLGFLLCDGEEHDTSPPLISLHEMMLAEKLRHDTTDLVVPLASIDQQQQPTPGNRCGSGFFGTPAFATASRGNVEVQKPRILPKKEPSPIPKDERHGFLERLRKMTPATHASTKSVSALPGAADTTIFRTC